jgi:hypothetical protein
MSAFRIEDHVHCRMVTPDGPLSITGEIIKIFPAGQSFWLHVRQGDGAVRMVYEATTQIETLELEAA